MKTKDQKYKDAVNRSVKIFLKYPHLSHTETCAQTVKHRLGIRSNDETFDALLDEKIAEKKSLSKHGGMK